MLSAFFNLVIMKCEDCATLPKRPRNSRSKEYKKGYLENHNFQNPAMNTINFWKLTGGVF
jgi:hypothetical protein